MSDSAAAQQLAEFVDQLSEPALRKLAATVELDRTEQRFGLPHDVIMQMLRPRLAEIRAPRVFTPQRILCVPFEDMLIFTDPDVKRTGEIARAAIPAMWSLLSEELATERWPPAAQAFVDAQKEGDDERRDEAASALWAIAAEELGAWIAEQSAEPDAKRRATKKLGGARRFEDVAEMARTLEIADIIESAKRDLPRKPIQHLTDRDVTALQRHYERVSHQASGRELYFLMAMMGRLLQPFPILKLIRALSRKLDDTLASNTDLGIAGDRVIDALEEDARQVAEIAEKAETGEEDVMNRTRRFAAAFRGITASIGIRRDGEWGQRMYAARNRVSAAVQQAILVDAQPVVLCVVPKRKKTPMPDFSALPDDALFERAERRARALGEAKTIAEEIGLQTACANEINALRKTLDAYAARIIERLPKVEDADKPMARAHLAVTVRLIELIANADEADLLRRRGNAALAGTAVS